VSAAWDDVLDEIDRSVTLVEDAISAGEDIPALPPFVPPGDVMPPMTRAQQARAKSLMRRQVGAEVGVSAQIVTTTLDLGEVRRRRRAASAYARA
jgi:hypothetical protein